MKPAMYYFTLAIVALFTLFFPKQALAQATPTPSAFENVPYYSPQSPQYANLVIINLIHTFSCLAGGVSVIGQPCLVPIPTQERSSGMKNYVQEKYLSMGAVGAITSFITDLYYTPPTSTVQYLANIGDDLGIIRTAHAQVVGSGNNVLFPVLNIWTVTRNLSYLAMILIFLVIGFMIMFRQKINPQTVISIQAAIPSLIIGVILITFSYFLSAVLIDLTFVGTHLAGAVLESSAIVGSGTTEELLNNQSILSIYNQFISPTSGSLKDAAPKAVNSTVETVSSLKNDGPIGSIFNTASLIGGCLIMKQVAPNATLSIKPFGIGVDIPIGKILACGLGGVSLMAILNITSLGDSFIGLILYLILMIALLIALFKLLFALLSNYITVILFTILAPFIFLMASIPGRQGAIGGWLKTMIANLLAFPAVFLALLFVAYILHWTDAPFNIVNKEVIFSKGAVPLLGHLNSQFLQIILSYGVLLILPGLPEYIRNAMGVKPIGLEKIAIGGFAAGFGVLSTGYNRWRAPIRKEREAYEDLRRKEEMQARLSAKQGPPGLSKAIETQLGNRLRPRLPSKIGPFTVKV